VAWCLSNIRGVQNSTPHSSTTTQTSLYNSWIYQYLGSRPIGNKSNQGTKPTTTKLDNGDGKNQVIGCMMGKSNPMPAFQGKVGC